MPGNKPFKLNTHHAYLNNEIVVTSKYNDIAVFVDGKKTELNTGFKLNAGKHTVKAIRYDKIYTDSVIIEDAIKLGGSTIKKVFVFDESPWLFLVAKDRTYIYNNDTDEGRVEYGFVPDDIIFLYDDFFLLMNKTTRWPYQYDYSVFNIHENRMIMQFSGELLDYSKRLICFKTKKIEEEQDYICVFDFIEEKEIIEVTDENKWSSCDTSIFLSKMSDDEQSTEFYIIDKNTAEQKSVQINWAMNCFQMYQQYVLTTRPNGYNYALIDLGRLQEIKKHPFWEASQHLFDSCFPIISFMGEALGSIDELNKLDNSYQFIQNKFHTIIRYYEIDDIGFNLFPSNPNKLHIHLNEIDVTTGFSRNEIRQRKILFCLNNYNLYRDAFEFEMPTKERTQPEIPEPSIKIEYEGRNVFRIANNNRKQILKGIYDNSHFENAFFSSDGSTIVIKSLNSEWQTLNFDNLETTPFDIQGITLPYCFGFNGYKLEFVPQQQGRLPVWRDPITLQFIDVNEDLSNRIYLSPNRKWSASVNYRAYFKDLVAGDEKITIDDKNKRKEKYKSFYDWDENTSKERQLFLINNRKKLFENNQPIASVITSKGIYPDTPITVKNLSDYLFSEMDYLVYKNLETNTEYETLIGQEINYLNYVSFSYDEKKMAIGAKCFRGGVGHEPGVFILIDLETKKEIKRIDGNSDGLWAVWMTLFSKNNDVAFYDSRPFSKIHFYDESDNIFENLQNRSLLAFSPKGTYLALSEQGYLSKTYHPDENWGHQPSGNVFIYSMAKHSQVAWYCDHGDKISGIKNRRGSVVSASFSQDEKRLLTVGNDGVIVIRNLNLNNESKQRDFSIRLGKAAREFNVGISTMVKFLATKGYMIDESPNTKLTNEIYDLLNDEFKTSQNKPKFIKTEDEDNDYTDIPDIPILDYADTFNTKSNSDNLTF